MGWFISKKKAAALAAVEQSQKISKQSRLDWIRNASKKDVAAAFKEVEDIFNSAYDPMGGAILDRPTHAKVMKAYKPIREEWLKVDRQYVSDADAVKMFNMVMSFLPEEAAWYKRHSASDSIWNVWNANKYGPVSHNLSSALSDAYEVISKIRREQMVLKATTSVSRVPAARPVEFPAFIPNDKNVLQELLRVKLLWSQVKNQDLTVEDAFFVEQAASSYIPEAWKLFESFQTSRSGAGETAKKIFLEQLSLIADRIQEIEAQEKTSKLQQMEAHTNFLRDTATSR